MKDSESLFYLQDTRSYVGNSVVWWSNGGSGYTTCINRAQKFTKKQADNLHKERLSDLPWPVEYIDQRVKQHIDMQDLEKEFSGTEAALKQSRILSRSSAEQLSDPIESSMIKFILDIDWMTTTEFCNTYKIPLPTASGGAAGFLAVDAIKHKMFVDHAKKLSRAAGAELINHPITT